MSTITSANATFALAVANVFPVPQTLGGWSADDAFSTEALGIGETVMGIDGQFHAGFVYNPFKMGLTIMPDSASILVFDAWADYERVIVDKTTASGTIILPAIKKMFVLSQGYITSVTPIADAKKVLQAMKYQIEWGKIVGVPI